MTALARMLVTFATAASFTADDAVLRLGEMGVETDTDKLKIGDGVTPWTALDYIRGGTNQTITLTGDVTGSGTGSFATTLATAQPAAHTWAATQTFAAITSTSVTSSGVVHSTSAGGITTRLFSSDGDTAGYVGTTTAHDFKILRSGTFVGSFSASNFTATLGVLSSHATSGVGYATGAGGTVTQLTSKATAVTLNKACGVVTTANVALNAGAIVEFVLNNTAIAATDLIATSHHATGTFGAYTINARATGAGTAAVTIRNNTGGNLTEAIQIKFAVIKGVTS